MTQAAPPPPRPLSSDVLASPVPVHAGSAHPAWDPHTGPSSVTSRPGPGHVPGAHGETLPERSPFVETLGLLLHEHRRMFTPGNHANDPQAPRRSSSPQAALGLLSARTLRKRGRTVHAFSFLFLIWEPPRPLPHHALRAPGAHSFSSLSWFRCVFLSVLPSRPPCTTISRSVTANAGTRCRRRRGAGG